MKKNNLATLAVIASLVLPVVALAQDANLTNLKRIATGISEIVKILIPVVFGIGILAFFWGLVGYLFGADHDKEKAKKTMLWGVIAVFVMAAIWGLVTFIGSTFGVDTGAGPITPDIDLPTVR